MQHILSEGGACLLFEKDNQETIVLVYKTIIRIFNEDRHCLHIHGLTYKTALCYMLYAFDVLVSRAGAGTCVMNVP